ncbi:MAG: hypothetical protein M1827_007350 [Pycnora praestabilis]|nr:MAG: hypothetical protein M1827_007350 [Pycnora praestabilis]
MELSDLQPLLDEFDDNIDELEETLEPLLRAALSETAAKLPLLDKAKLYILVTYAIESILFSFLRLNGVRAKNHPVFRELTRVKQYFDKIKHVEASGMKTENPILDKEAAGRFIKHALAGNERYDVDRVKQQAKKKARLHNRFEQPSKKRKLDASEQIVKAQEEHSTTSSSSERPGSRDMQEFGKISGRSKKKVKERREKQSRMENLSGGDQAANYGSSEISMAKTDMKDSSNVGDDTDQEETLIPSKPDQAPLGHTAAFQALLNGPLPKQGKKLKKKERMKAEGKAA